jgi:hypothetical protein
VHKHARLVGVKHGVSRRAELVHIMLNL